MSFNWVLNNLLKLIRSIGSVASRKLVAANMVFSVGRTILLRTSSSITPILKLVELNNWGC